MMIRWCFFGRRSQKERRGKEKGSQPPVVLAQSSKDLPPPDSLAKCQSLVAPIITCKGLLWKGVKDRKGLLHEVHKMWTVHMLGVLQRSAHRSSNQSRSGRIRRWRLHHFQREKEASPSWIVVRANIWLFHSKLSSFYGAPAALKGTLLGLLPNSPASSTEHCLYEFSHGVYQYQIWSNSY